MVLQRRRINRRLLNIELPLIDLLKDHVTGRFLRSTFVSGLLLCEHVARRLGQIALAFRCVIHIFKIQFIKSRNNTLSEGEGKSEHDRQLLYHEYFNNKVRCLIDRPPTS